MPKLIDLTHKEFNQLRVIERADNIGKQTAWLCECSCGERTTVRGADLKNNHTKSCGCLRDVKNSERTLNDLTGKYFDNLKVLKRVGSANNRKALWECECKCGSIINVIGTDLTTGHTKSCGCIKSFGEKKIAEVLKDNNINFIKEYTFEDLRYKNKLRFDFAILNKDGKLIKLVEFDGKQHYENDNFFGGDTKKTDEIKNNYCKNNNITLVRIPYWERDKITLSMLLGNQYLIS